MNKKHIIDAQTGVEEIVDFTSEEETQLATDTADELSKKETKQNAIAEKETLKASAKAKLIAGEALTEDEANTIVL
jgi:hypothetical protein